jgi:hypothetical protein
MKILKSWKKFNENRTRWQSDESPINYNSGAYSFHLNFDIRDITNNNPPIYPGGEYTTDSEGKALLEQFVEAIQKHDISEIKEFKNGKKTLFDEEVWVVSCGSNNLNMREIPKEICKYTLFKTGPYESNYLNEKQYELTKPVADLEEGKIYTAFTFTNYEKDYTGIIDVTEEVKKFIEMNKM